MTFFFKYKNLRKETIRTYKNVICQLLKKYPNLDPQDITDEQILAWRDAMLLTAKPVSWNNYARHMRSLYNFGIEQELLVFKKNPFRAFFLRTGKEKKKAYTDSQLARIDTFINQSYCPIPYLSPFWFTVALVKTFRYTGMRRNQLVNLTLEDIDLTRHVICIASSTNKNHNYHEIPISSHLYPHLAYLIAEMRKRGSISSDQLFNLNVVSQYTNNKRKKMTINQVDYIFEHISKFVGFRVSSHRFRHTIATNLMRNPNNLYITKQLLGHSDLKVTLGYVQYDSDMLQECVDNL